MLKVENLSFSYGKIQAVRDVSFELKKGEIMAIVGANGAGKSSLMKCITGLLKPQSGKVILGGEQLEPAAYKTVGKGLCLVPEGRWIFPNLTVEENLTLGGYTSKTVAQGIERAYDMFPRLGERRGQRAGTMSGGEQQMLAIARGLMSNPKVLLLDEPSLGLAPLIVNDIMRIIQNINEEGISILLVEQNARKALAIAHHACVLKQGKIVKEGTGAELAGDESIIAEYLGSTKNRMQVFTMNNFEKDYLKIEGKTAIVTGAGRGIGKAIAMALARYGVKVMLCDIQDEWMKQTSEEIREFGGVCRFIHCDVSDSSQVKAAVESAVCAFGTVDILVNDAGIGSVPIAFEEISNEAWEKMLKTDLYSAFYFTREVVPYMKKQKWGKIISVSSGSGVIGCEYCSHYATAKAAMIGFTESIAKELAPFHINANVIATPTTDTPQLAETDFDVFVEDEIKEIPWGRIGKPDDIADMVLYLASDASEYVSGQILAPNGARRTPV